MATLTEPYFPAPSRRFKRLVLGSLALHAAVLAWVNGPHPLPAPERLVTLSLQLLERPAANTRIQPASLPPPALSAKANTPPTTRKQSTTTAPALPATAPPEARQSPSSTATPSPAVAGGTVGPTTAVPAAPPPAPVADQQHLLSRYAQQLSKALAQQQGYPRLAALRGWEGEVRLRLRIARKGQLLAIDVDRSSGYDILDQHALQLVDASGPLPSLPDELNGNEIQITVPVSYKLRKTT